MKLECVSVQMFTLQGLEMVNGIFGERVGSFKLTFLLKSSKGVIVIEFKIEIIALVPPSGELLPHLSIYGLSSDRVVVQNFVFLFMGGQF